MLLFIITTFLGSFLLFSLQPLTGKVLLPYFGGTNTVWSTVLFFFINSLLFGYIYTYLLSKQKVNKQKKIHKAIIALNIAFVVMLFLTNKQIIPSQPNPIALLTKIPSLQIITTLLSTLFLPSLLLNTTSTLLQFWHTRVWPNKSPHYLYSYSNTGSLLGLLSYPLLIEPNLTLSAQQKLWLFFFLIYLLLFFKTTNFKTTKNIQTKKESPHKTDFAIWFVLSSISNFVLIATTSTITQSVTPSPLFWIIPLALFLLSFILGFSSKFYQRQFFSGILAFSVFIVLSSLNNFFEFKVYWATTAFIIFYQFILSLVCHSELYKHRPQNNNLIVHFYLAIALGGSFGSLLGGIVAPNFFKDTWELPLSLGAAALIYFVILLTESKNIYQKGLHFIVATFLLFLTIQYFSNPHKTLLGDHSRIIYSARNFYGAIKVTKDKTPSSIHPYNKTLFNGNINHGFQTFNTSGTHVPTIYYAPHTGIGQYIEKELTPINPKNQRIGIIGLGVGALAGYCKPGSYFRFYEINPLIVEISQKHFTFLKNCEDLGGVVDIVDGDARTSLQNEMNTQQLQKFDILVIDAFTDDAIPTHLLTLEAISLFLKHLKADGVLAYHISNRHLKLEEVLYSASAKLNLYSKLDNTNDSSWFFISTKQKDSFRSITSSSYQSKVMPWTDDYSNLLSIIR